MSSVMDDLEVWFVTGSQHLYGPELLEQVAEHARAIAAASTAGRDPGPRRLQAGRDHAGRDRRRCCREANAAPDCVGVIAWMHTFSPAKMWIAGLTACQAARPPPHAVQPRPAVGRDRHGLHEPEPVGPRRPGVRVHRRPACGATARRSSATGRTRRRRPARVVGARRGRLARGAPAPDRPLRRQHARGRGHRGRQGRGPARLGFSVNGYGVGDLVAARRRASPTPRSTA